MRCHVGYVVGVVGNAFFEQSEDVVGQLNGGIGSRTYAHRVISAKGFEAKRKDIYLGVDTNVIGAFEFRHCLLGAHIGMQKGGCATVYIVENVAHTQCASLCHVDIGQPGHRYIILIIAYGRVHLIAKHIAIEKIARIGVLCHCRSCKCHTGTEYD